ncbi:MAG TPA: glycine--tRNA ligase subunit beta, partial [bacterium]|nr:glycine--tRNA ligase subunit beta [bacterium]
ILFEICTEELPATNLADLFESTEENILIQRAKKAFEDKRISFKNCSVWATPRRLVFYLEEAAPAQAPKETMIRILSKEEAYGADGKPTEKLLMILKHRNTSPHETVIADLNGKPYCFIKKSEPAKATAAVLPEILEALLKSLPFPKNMKWGCQWPDGSDFYFPRPIRHLLCFYGDKPLSCKLASIKVENKTSVFSKGARAIFLVKDIPSYFKLLRQKGVILDPAERKSVIREELDRLAASLKGRLYEDPFLLNEVGFLVENPYAIHASFGSEFLTLPSEVLTVSMARKQRIFGMLDGRGKVLPHFLAVLDGTASPKEKKEISGNYEHILRAKLQDSLFFFEEDKRVSLETRQPQLKEMPFLGHAGSMLEKSQRLVRLAKNMASRMGLSEEEKIALTRAAQLGKADLLTHMVGEFPELQGIMGKYYALESGEDPKTAAAIGEQYLPRTVQDKLPESLAGSLLAIFDKADLVTACFGQGLEPSSSLDPYGLRRSAGAVVRIVLDNKIDFSLLELIDDTVRQLDPYIQADRKAALGRRLRALFEDRFLALLVERGFRKDLVEAVMATNFSSPFEAYRRLESLNGFCGEELFSKAWKVVERTVNILKGNKETLPDKIDPSFFAEELEREVFRHYEASHQAIRRAVETRDYRVATDLYASAFFDILDEFFEKVFVNAEDLNVKRNRLALLRAVKELYTDKLADLSKIRLMPIK